MSFFITSCRFGNSENNDDNSNSKNLSDIKLNEGDTISGQVVSVIDGDTYDILVNNDTTIRIRMEGIDAPEKGMAYNKVAKNYLSDLCFNKTIKLIITGKDRYNRILSFSYLNDTMELSHEMIKAGYAWHFKKYNNDNVLSELEIVARNSKKGLWYDKDPIPPWEFRKLLREGNTSQQIYKERNNSR